MNILVVDDEEADDTIEKWRKSGLLLSAANGSHWKSPIPSSSPIPPPYPESSA